MLKRNSEIMLKRMAVYLYIKSPSIIKKILRKIYGKNVKVECESDILREIWRQYYGVEIGKYTYGCFNDCFPAGTIVGRYCSISKEVKVLNANHPVESVCLTPFFYNKSLGLDVKDVPRSKLVIGNDVWIGYGAIILSKCVSIGNGAIIGAGSVVTKNVPPYSIVVGNPAKVLRYRFDDEICKKIELTQWWEKTPEALSQFVDFMNNPKDFYEKYNGVAND